MWWTLFVLLALSALGGGKGLSKKELDIYSWRIGNALFDFGRIATNYKDIRGKFQTKESKIVPINLNTILYEVAKTMNESLRKKVEAVEKVMVFAEGKALDHYNRTTDVVTPTANFYESKNTTFVSLTPDDHFHTSVNTDFSSVHIPTSIYEKNEKVLEAITWSSDLDASFRTNYKDNPTLSWQYFGSSTGFLRHYPARKWPKGNDVGAEDKLEDLYDCRTRPWYVAAANSPKNIVILQDVSGSMTGLRSEIAKRVIYTILDTLTENDYVNVYNFSNNSVPLVDCFKDRLVEANLENIREYKIALEQGETKGFAVTERAFESAYEMLENNFGSRESSHCNQAIMLITDGSSEYYQPIFDRRNPSKRIRLFTFLIGREVTDFREVLWMACYNRGYYSHITTLGEVQEEVLKYIPIMSRPMVMSEKHNVAWTPVYADLAEVVESDWQWKEKTKAQQRQRSNRYKVFYQRFLAAKKKENKSLIAEFTTEEEMRKTHPDHLPNLFRAKVVNYLDHGQTNVSERLVRTMRAEKERNEIIDSHRWGKFDPQFHFVISASIPVFDKRKYNTSGDNERIANFLGVVGTDISVKELQKMTSSFHLGVNGYAFAITNNGYVVFHPDWRPLYGDILRPNYNTVDFSELELLDSDMYPRNRHPRVLEFRKAMIDTTTQNNSLLTLDIRSHGDNFKRVRIRRRQYAYGKIDGTLYTLGLSVPFGANRYIGAVELFRLAKDRRPYDGQNTNPSRYFESDNPRHKWILNPNWSYCEYLGSSDTKFNENKEVLLIHFLQRIQQSNQSWAWMATNISRPYMCDKDLVQSLVFDAELTQNFAAKENFFRSSILGNATSMSFVATRSGLTRWIDYTGASSEAVADIPFIPYYGSATEELWYQRAVDWNAIDEDVLVFSVPFDAGTRSSAQITMTQAVIVRKEGLRAPVAVVGLQLDLDKFISFLNLSSGADVRDPYSRNFCQNPDYDCFILDDNGFILSSENRYETGRFFGEIDGKIMEILIKAGVYKPIVVTDFQAVCLHPVVRSNFGNILFTPIQNLKLVFNWFVGRLAWAALQLNLHAFINPDYASVLADLSESEESAEREVADGGMPFIKDAYVNKTKLRPCDKEYKLYTYGPEYIMGNSTVRSNESCHQKCDDFLSAQRIPKTNLLIVVALARCRCGREKITIDGKEIEYALHSSFVGKTDVNPVLLELCRIPYSPLYRKKPTHCYAYNIEENDMKEDCGSDSNGLKPSCIWLLGIIIIQCCIVNIYDWA